MLMRTPDRWVRPKRRQPPGFILPCQPMLADKVRIVELKGFSISFAV
jgi:hypothetical protein